MAWSNQVSLLLSVVRVFSQSFAMKICVFSLQRAAQAFENTTHWHTALHCCPGTRWKKQGGSRSCETKRAAASIDPWAEDASFLVAGKASGPLFSASLTFPVFLLVLPARPLDSKVCSPLTETNPNAGYKATETWNKNLLPFLEQINLGSLRPSKIPSSWWCIAHGVGKRWPVQRAAPKHWQGMMMNGVIHVALRSSKASWWWINTIIMH